jgi:hypothetical protein
MKPRLLLFAPVALVMIGLLIFLGGEVTRLLWNYVVPPLVGWREITFWQALGLLALCRILFGSFNIHGSSRSHSALRHRLADRMADRVAARWEHMSSEERERFRQRIRERCGFDLATGDSAGQ